MESSEMNGELQEMGKGSENDKPVEVKHGDA